MNDFFTNLMRLNWKFVALFVIALFYVGICVTYARDEKSPIHYGGDYLAFWSAGKVADEIGFSQIYDLENLRLVQEQALVSTGIISESGNSSFLTLPAPYLSFFLLPLWLLSNLDINQSYWLWTVLNLAVLVSYLSLIIKKAELRKRFSPEGVKLLALALVSYPVFSNLINGQLNVFLMVCTGEFFRNVLKEKPFLSGVWLAGLLLKPQLLVLIVPIIFIMKYWRVLSGFMITSGAIIFSSLLLSGIDGMMALIKLWTNWGETNAITAPAAMINWRMIGLQINQISVSSFGWIIAGFGILTTLGAIIYILKFNPNQAERNRVKGMLGIFCGTLVITWHAHFHMALILLPLFVFTSTKNRFWENQFFLWVIFPPFVWILALMGTIIGLNLNQVSAVAITGFITTNLAIFSVVKSLHPQNRKSNS